MARIFLSHSSGNNAEAIALRDWLIGHGWDDLFLDLDPERGLKAGERWQAALKQAAETLRVGDLPRLAGMGRIEVVPRRVPARQEPQQARLRGDRRADAFLRPSTEMTAEWQLVDLTAGKRDHKVTVRPPPGDKTETVAFAEDGLERLRIGLMQAGLDARYFAWPPENDPERCALSRPRAARGRGRRNLLWPRRPHHCRPRPAAGLERSAPTQTARHSRRIRGGEVVVPAGGAASETCSREPALPALAGDQTRARGDQRRSGADRQSGDSTEGGGLPRTRADIRKAVEAGPAECGLAPSGPRQGEHGCLDGDGTKSRKAPALVLAIDQAEELFHAEGCRGSPSLSRPSRQARCRGQPGADRPLHHPLRLLRAAADGQEPWRAFASTRLSLPPMPKGAYAEVIKGPARRLEGTNRALKIEEALVDALLADIEEGGAKDALPLLAFTLGAALSRGRRRRRSQALRV